MTVARDASDLEYWRAFFQEHPLAYQVLKHTWTYGPDTPTIIRKRLLGHRSGVGVEVIREAYALLLEAGLVERMPGKELDRNQLTSSVKKTLKRRAKYHTPRKTHTYYRLSRTGELVARALIHAEG
ncbi:conserved protein of unknown function [Candidatus Hydrogenisulfobacillus filiaventi]|uniref:Uncharacterized protein n=1 Tax=Candidatus Hydrogenisulfobacillus filiaventi TaxID=2707344 RepID=A0A6F8ZJK7_9FIRM|nr:conserved protein of unknown function [Candidatus Hydrogenisulfobacillus filiaventi]